MSKSTPEVTPVTMTDGRVVEFTGKKRLDKVAIENPDGTLAVRLDWRNGETRTYQLNPGLLAKFALHGALQKLGDEISGITEIEDAVEAVDQLMARLEQGPSGWTVAREASGSGFAGASALARALVKVTGKDIGTVRTYLGTLDGKTKAALRLEPSVAAAVREIEAEQEARRAARGKSAPKVDVASVLAGLTA